MFASLALVVWSGGCASVPAPPPELPSEPTIEASFPPAEIPSLGTELAACPCARRDGQLLLYVRIGAREKGGAVPVASLAFALFSANTAGAAGDPLPVSIRQPHPATVSNDLVPLVMDLTPAIGRVLRLEISVGGSAPKALHCAYSGVRR